MTFVPIIALLGVAGLAAYFFERKGAISSDPEIEAAMAILTRSENRPVAMAKLADVLYRIIASKTALKTTFLKNEPEFACQIAARIFGLTKTVAGIRTSQGLPTDERWPGSDLSVSQYMYEYTQAQHKATTPGAPPAPSAVDKVIAVAPQVKNTIVAIANIFKK